MDCPTCDTPVSFALEEETGAWTPFDVDPAPDGTYQFVADGGHRVAREIDRARIADPNARLMRLHRCQPEVS